MTEVKVENVKAENPYKLFVNSSHFVLLKQLMMELKAKAVIELRSVRTTKDTDLALLMNGYIDGMEDLETHIKLKAKEKIKEE